MLITIGIALGYFVAYASSRNGGELAWRTPFILEASMAAILVSGMAFMPYSPRWLVQRGRIDEARAVLQKLRASSESVEDELRLIKGSLEEQSREDASYREIFQKRYIRRSVLSVFLMSFQMLCGVCVVLNDRWLIRIFLDRCGPLLRSDPVHSSWFYVKSSSFPCVWCFRNNQLDIYDTCLIVGRQVGAKISFDWWWYFYCYLLHGHRCLVCDLWRKSRRTGVLERQRTTMGRHHTHIHVCGMFRTCQTTHNVLNELYARRASHGHGLW